MIIELPSLTPLDFARGKHGWRNGVSAHLSPLWPRFDSRTWSHVSWVCCWFSPLLWGFFSEFSSLCKKSTFMDRGPHVYQLIQLSSVTLVKQRRLFIYLFPWVSICSTVMQLRIFLWRTNDLRKIISISNFSRSFFLLHPFHYFDFHSQTWATWCHPTVTGEWVHLWVRIRVCRWHTCVCKINQSNIVLKIKL
jgi:hypothetical protein